MADADYDGQYGGFAVGLPDAWLTTGKAQSYARIAGAVASAALVVGFAVWGYRLAVLDVHGVPVIQALDGAMRVAPVDPGGEIVDYQGLAVNDVAAAGVATPMPEKLILAPRPVELIDEDIAGLAGLPPLDPLQAVAPLPLPDESDIALAAAPPEESASPTEIAIEAALAEALGEVPPVAADPAPVGVVLSDPPSIDPVIAEPAPGGAITVSPRPKARPATRSAAASTTAELPDAPAEIDPQTIPAGTRLVQFGAFDTAEEARLEWARLSGQFGALMADKKLVLQPAESGGRTFVRLRAHGFEDEDDARRFCSAFTAANATCIPVPQR